MSILYERIASALIGTPLQKPAERLRAWRGARERSAHPELAEWHLENERIDAVLQRVLGRASNAIDVGAHLGTYLQRIVELAPQGRHRAVEPVPRKAAWLRRKFPRVEILELALGDGSGEGELFVAADASAYSGIRRRALGGAAATVPVRLARLDDVVAEDAGIGFVKIDVNGAELGVLRGAQRLLARDRPFVLLECTLEGLVDYGVDAAEVFDTVAASGYRLQLLREFLAGGPALTLERFRRSMTYPFEAMNYAMTPSRRD